MNKYKSLFEGKFVETHDHAFTPIQKLYYQISPSTYGERIMFNALRDYTQSTYTKRAFRILDIGCGGGHAYLRQYGAVYGVDISTSSLKNAKRIYKEVKEADVTKRIPYPQSYFDIIFCGEVFGHIAKKDKKTFLREVKRVCKPDGYLFFSIETEGDNLFTRYLRKKSLYKKIWIDYQGHIGLEKPSDTVNRLAAEFHIVKVNPASTHILPLDNYLMLGRQHIPFYGILNNSTIRRIINMLIAPAFHLSLRTSSFDQANDIIVVMQNI